MACLVAAIDRGSAQDTSSIGAVVLWVIRGCSLNEDAHRICSSRTCHSTSCCVSLRDASRCELSCSKRLGHSAVTAADTFTVSSTSAVACAKVPAVTHGVFEDAETTFAAISRSDDGTQSPQVAV